MHYKYSDIGEIIQVDRDKPHSLIVLLDHITDVGNFGAVVRSAEVLGAAGIIIPNRRSVDVTDVVFKRSAGAINDIKVAKVANLAQAIDTLKQAEYWVYGADAHNADNLFEAKLTGKMALVMGAEDTGLSDLVVQKCDFKIKIPQVGRTESLNIACAASIIMAERLRQVQA